MKFYEIIEGKYYAPALVTTVVLINVTWGKIIIYTLFFSLWIFEFRSSWLKLTVICYRKVKRYLVIRIVDLFSRHPGSDSLFYTLRNCFYFSLAFSKRSWTTTKNPPLHAFTINRYFVKNHPVTVIDFVVVHDWFPRIFLRNIKHRR